MTSSAVQSGAAVETVASGSGSVVAGTILGLSPVGFAPVSRQDYHVLVEGTGTTSPQSFRDVAIGVFATALTTAASVWATTDFGTDDGEKANIAALVVCIAFLIFGVAAGLYALSMHKFISNEAQRKSYWDLRARLDSQFAAFDSKNQQGPTGITSSVGSGTNPTSGQ